MKKKKKNRKNKKKEKSELLGRGNKQPRCHRDCYEGLQTRDNGLLEVEA